ncbi:hypothetical protein K469DRAFT_752836 [Zopfia rhizophila CBS 207.26]|uniref:Uncharacterized protein n=1 Tax=Zopfia rhizophila CBS 207.26 TaxID=1314779 RepID=A0A6A6DQP7_9PEZI|nr:hypothetical protein K469DRAFT_752836 [Zopfia rhizophila CBS 207.26]
MTREEPFEVDALIAKVEDILSRLKKIKDEIQQPHLRRAAYRKTTRSDASLNLETISQTLRGINGESTQGENTWNDENTLNQGADNENTLGQGADNENTLGQGADNENTLGRGGEATVPDNDQNTQNSNNLRNNKNSQNNGNFRNDDYQQVNENTQDHAQITRYQEGHLQHPSTANIEEDVQHSSTTNIGVPNFQCKAEDLGITNMVQTLQKLASHEGVRKCGTARVTVTNFVKPTLTPNSFSTPSADEFKRIYYQNHLEGSVQVCSETSGSFKILHFTMPEAGSPKLSDQLGVLLSSFFNLLGY